jgi:phosphoribosylcarboxyaminoimidazole (NCAIR) mutase
MIGIIMGSRSDLEVMREAADTEGIRRGLSSSPW